MRNNYDARRPVIPSRWCTLVRSTVTGDQNQSTGRMLSVVAIQQFAIISSLYHNQKLIINSFIKESYIISKEILI